MAKVRLIYEVIVERENVGDINASINYAIGREYIGNLTIVVDAPVIAFFSRSEAADDFT